jgi:hypothetical protein
MPLGRSEEKDFSTRQQLLNRRLLHSVMLKIQIQRGRKTWILKINLRYDNNFCLLKNDKWLGPRRESDFFRVFDNFTNSFIAFQPSQKCDLVEVEKAIFKQTIRCTSFSTSWPADNWI